MTTDSRGSFLFADVGPDTYTVKIAMQGFKNASEQTVAPAKAAVFCAEEYIEEA